MIDLLENLLMLNEDSMVSRVFDTNNPPYDNEDDNDSVIGNVGIYRDKSIITYHVTSDPTPVINTLKSGKSLIISRGGYDCGDLGGGLYGSLATNLWSCRATGKWSFLQDLDQKQKELLANSLKNEINDQKSSHYISNSEYESGVMDINNWLAGKSGDNVIVQLSGQPYNIQFWEEKYLSKLGIKSGKKPIEIKMKLRGKFAVLNRNPVQSEVESLRKDGFDGALTKGGWSTTPQIVVWNNDSVIEFGDYHR